MIKIYEEKFKNRFPQWLKSIDGIDRFELSKKKIFYVNLIINK